MAYGVKRGELNRYKNDAATGGFGVLTHYWQDPRFPTDKTVTKIGSSSVENLIEWGKPLGLYPFMIDKKRTDLPHYDLFGEIQKDVLLKLKRYNMLSRFQLISKEDLEEQIMPITLKNDKITVQINPKGAELASIKSNQTGIEYLWTADEAHWARHAPVLFPIVGRLKNDEYHVGDKAYQMGQHGFARDEMFDVVVETDTVASFKLESSSETKKKYPYDFTLIITYTLTGSQVKTTYVVENPSNQLLYFSIGAHPGFNVPLVEGSTFEDYYLSFNPRKTRTIIPLKGAYIDLANRTLAQTNADIALRRELFANDALIYENKGTSTISIKSDKTKHGVSVNFSGFPFVGVWTKPDSQAPFVCIEPWYGIADTLESTGDLTEKYAIQTLESDKTFEASFDIEVF